MKRSVRAYTKIVEAELGATSLQSHSPTKGGARERVIRDSFLRHFLPRCYGVGSGLVFSADGNDSRQVDIVIYDDVYSIVLRKDKENLLFPCESVFGSIEVKSSLNSKELKQAVENIRSLKNLKRESSDGLDFTPVARLNVGKSLTYDKTGMNPYLGIVLALNGMSANKVCSQLVRCSPEHRKTLPDYIFNLKQQYMVSRWVQKNGRKDIDCRISDYDGFLFFELGSDTLPVFYLTLNTILNRTRLKQPNIGYTWIKVINECSSGREMLFSWSDHG